MCGNDTLTDVRQECPGPEIYRIYFNWNTVTMSFTVLHAVSFSSHITSFHVSGISDCDNGREILHEVAQPNRLVHIHSRRYRRLGHHRLWRPNGKHESSFLFFLIICSIIVQLLIYMF